MRFTRMIVTAATARWVDAAVSAFTGYGTSVIQCDAEVGLERLLDPSETFDGRPGASMLAFGFSSDALAEAIGKRSGQCLMTCATTAVFDGYPRQQYIEDQQRLLQQKKSAGAKQDVAASSQEIEPQKRIPVGSHLRFFGDGFQKSKMLGERRFWRIPVMDGEFICEDQFGTFKGVGGGNILIAGNTRDAALTATINAVQAMRNAGDVALPFPGGFVRSGSKVGSQYKALKASTNEKWCPTLRSQTTTELPDDAEAVYEIVVDGTSFETVQNALRAGVQTATQTDGIVLISAGNYGGKLGKHHFYLRDLI